MPRGRPPIRFMKFHDWKNVRDVLTRFPGIGVMGACRFLVERRPRNLEDGFFWPLYRCNTAEIFRARYNAAERKYRTVPGLAAEWDALERELNTPLLPTSQRIRMGGPTGLFLVQADAA
jgi:hypothetical protein